MIEAADRGHSLATVNKEQAFSGNSPPLWDLILLLEEALDSI